jgi:hypothetical protein
MQVAVHPRRDGVGGADLTGTPSRTATRLVATAVADDDATDAIDATRCARPAADTDTVTAT